MSLIIICLKLLILYESLTVGKYVVLGIHFRVYKETIYIFMYQYFSFLKTL